MMSFNSVLCAFVRSRVYSENKEREREKSVSAGRRVNRKNGKTHNAILLRERTIRYERDRKKSN